jgi:UDP-N-acetylmuramate--alanine ligase
MRDRGHRHVHRIDAPDQLAPMVHSLAHSGDIVVCLGAGTITQWAYALPQKLAAFGEKAPG